MMLNTVYNTMNIGGLCTPQEVLPEANYLVKIEMVDGTSQLVQITKEQATALGIEFSETTEMQSEVINVENVDAGNPNSIQLKIVPAKTQYNYKVIQPEDLNLRPNLPVPALALPRGRPKKRTPSDHIETKQEPPPKIIKRARTRCGRISRPPVHMEKVFKLVSNEDSSTEQRTTSKPTQTENLIIPSEPPPLILKKIDKPEPPPAPAQPPKKKRVISAQYRCSTCHKAYLGRNRMAQHLKKHPDHGLNSDFNLDDNEAWECLIETALKAKEGHKGNKFCNEFITLVKNARTLAKYFFKPAKIGKAEYHVDDFLSGLLNLKVGDYRFNENELCKDVSIFSFLEYFDDNFITADAKPKPEHLKPGELSKARSQEIDATLREMHFLNEKINDVTQNKHISLSDELNDLLKASKIEINKTTDELNKINSLNEKINKCYSINELDRLKLPPNYQVGEELDVGFQVKKNSTSFPVSNELEKIRLLDSELNKIQPFLNMKTNKTNEEADAFKSLEYLNKGDKLNYPVKKAEKQNEETLKTSASVDLHFGSEIIDVIKSASPKNTDENGKEIDYVETHFFNTMYPQTKEAKQPDYAGLFLYDNIDEKRKESEGKSNFVHVFNGDKGESKSEQNYTKLQKDGKNFDVLLEKHNLDVFSGHNGDKNDFGDLFDDKNKASKNNFDDLFEDKNKEDFALNKNDFGDLFVRKDKTDKGELQRIFEDKNKQGDDNFRSLYEQKNKPNKNDFDELFEAKSKTNKNDFVRQMLEGKNVADKNSFSSLFEEKEKTNTEQEKNKADKNDFVNLFEEKDKMNKTDFTDLLFDAHMSLNLLSSPQKVVSKDKIEENYGLNLLVTPEKTTELKKLNSTKQVMSLESSGLEVSNFNLNLLTTPEKNSSENGVKSLENSKEIMQGIEVRNFNLNLLSTPDKMSSNDEVKSSNDGFLSSGKKEVKYDNFLLDKKDIGDIKYNGFLTDKKDVAEVKYDSFLSSKKDIGEVRSLEGGGVEVMDLHKLHLLSDELILPVGEGAGILDTSTNSDDIMNVDQFVNERFKKLTGAVDEVMSGLEMPHLDCFNFHPS